MERVGLFLFTNDLRLHDNAPLRALAARVDRLICVSCIAPLLSRHCAHLLGEDSASHHRQRFIRESLDALDRALGEYGQHLLVCHQRAYQALPMLIERFQVDEVMRSRHPGSEEQQDWQALAARFPTVRFLALDSQTLFTADSLPFSIYDLPATASQFHQQVASLTVPSPLPPPNFLPPPPAALQIGVIDEPAPTFPTIGFTGGEAAGLRHLQDYFDSHWPSLYKSRRDELQGWHHSTKLSPWLANGCISPRRIVQALRDYQTRHGSDPDSDWIYVELLWREFFQWYAYKFGERLLSAQGIKSTKPLTSFYPQRFKSWCAGNTPWPLVNACMRQLKSTGYLSNRGRQIVASCLIHELQLDWRYGAAYFEQQLIDYDLASNWGNWQYLAGVGADPRGQRRFDIDKQAARFDPQGSYTRRWQGEFLPGPGDDKDIADWPLTTPSDNQ